MTRFLILVLSLALGCATLGCASNDDGVGTGGTGASGGTAGTGASGGTGGSGGQVFSPDPPLVIGGEERPANVAIPVEYDPAVSHPLLIVLHGFGATGQVQAGYFRLLTLIDEKGYVLVIPDGTMNANGRRFWNATEACCDPTDSVDDVGYLSGLVEEAQETYNIDPKRVYLMGHSNGGFMSLRMACERSDLITAVVSLAGSTFDDPADCQPATLPVSVLAVHGTADTTIPYDGAATFGSEFPGAVETIERFAAAANCDTNSPTDEGSRDYVPDVEGAETDRVGYSVGCEPGVDSALWTIRDGIHIPLFRPEFADDATNWLLRHSR